MLSADPSTPDPIKNGTDQSFMADVIEASKAQPVIVDFWAPWCGPCRQLTPILEKSVRAAKGKVKLVKINIDENPAVAGQLGVRSIPAVVAFDKGRPADGFVGVLPESQLKMFIDKLAGGGAGGAPDLAAVLAEADAALKMGDVGGAAQLYAALLEADPENAKALAGLARCYLAAGEPDQARALIEALTDEMAKDPAIQGVRAALELASGVDTSEIGQLTAKVQAQPSAHDARFELAKALAARGDLDAAVTHLMTILEQDREWNEGAAKAQLFKIFEAAGPTAEVTKTGRRKLSALLFS